jgi:integrase
VGLYQDDKQVKRHGAAKASWYVGWFEPGGRKRCQSCGPGAAGKNFAQKLRRKREAELIEGTYETDNRRTWEQFRAEYKEKVLEGMGIGNRLETLNALNHFERLVKPNLMRSIDSTTIMDFVAKRRSQRGRKKTSIVSPATINKELRELRAALKKARTKKYMTEAPAFDFLKQPRKLAIYVPPDHFAKLYGACDAARWPEQRPFSPADFWRGLLIMAYMTGWRIGALMALRWEDVDLDAGRAKSRAEDNKGKRDDFIPLHAIVVEHLRKLKNFHLHVFAWDHERRDLFQELHRIEDAAGVKPDGEKERYGFNDFRRAFATMNADRLTPDALQALMQQKDYQTTQRYISMARQLNPAVQNLFVPGLKLAAAGSS